MRVPISHVSIYTARVREHFFQFELLIPRVWVECRCAVRG
jgi:hypothetical protein